MEPTSRNDLTHLTDERPFACPSYAWALRWFAHSLGSATTIQRLAWPALAEGDNLLVSAPTGSGKTLASFLPLLAKLVNDSIEHADSTWEVGSRLQLLYVAPLRALTNDMAKNIDAHLDGMLRHADPRASRPRVGVRHGDTSAQDRRALVEDPPEILLTTPESLAILLSQPALTAMFESVRWVVLDELHALAGSKRGADLAMSIERIDQCSEHRLQRIGLSATATPLEKAARFLVGPHRPCSIACAVNTTPLELQIALLDPSRSFLADLVSRLEPILASERTTLVFTTTRSLAERLSWALRQRRPEWTDRIAVHHSALAAGRRCEVETQLRAGQLRAVITSTSLELGIDIGPIDRVVLVHPPGDVVRLLQRLGRSGHGPYRSRRGLILASNPTELLEATVTAASGLDGQCEPIPMPETPLDVLCQQILGMACTSSWSCEEMYNLVRRAYPFRDLTRSDFEACLRYLLGQDSRGQDWIPARLAGSFDEFRIRNNKTARILRQNIGTILSDESVLVRIESTTPSGDEFLGPEWITIGEVDPTFAEQLQPGDRFLLDGKCLEMRRLEMGNLLVQEVVGRPMTPRWTGEGWPLSTELARRLYLLRVRAAEALRDSPSALQESLAHEYGLAQMEVMVLADHFQRQEAVSEIPEPGLCLLEAIFTEAREVFSMHTPLNRAGNDALARVVVHRLQRDYQIPAMSIVADLGWSLLLSGNTFAHRGDADLANLWRTLLRRDGFVDDLHAALDESPTLRERFQRVATTGLMILRNPDGQRRRVGGQRWGERRLFEQVRVRDAEFVLLRQARREILKQWCDAESACQFAKALPTWSIRLRWLNGPSPFVESWTQEIFGAFSTESPEQALTRLHAELTSGAAEFDGG